MSNTDRPSTRLLREEIARQHDLHALAQRERDEWNRAADFYRRCKADPTSAETGAMRDAIDWLLKLAERPAAALEPPNCDVASTQLAEAQRFLHHE